jgi:hypothetical protein
VSSIAAITKKCRVSQWGVPKRRPIPFLPSQYTHTAWKVREGFSKGVIFSIAQTPDGYLWLGTEFPLMACGTPRGGRQQASVFPAAMLEACTLRATGVFGLAPFWGLQVGKGAN